MKLYKTWLIDKPDFNEADLLWCRKYADSVQVNQDRDKVIVNGMPVYFAKGRTITVETVTQKQENMLQLKYSPMLLLVAQWRTIGNGWAVRNVDGSEYSD